MQRSLPNHHSPHSLLGPFLDLGSSRYTKHTVSTLPAQKTTDRGTVLGEKEKGEDRPGSMHSQAPKAPEAQQRSMDMSNEDELGARDPQLCSHWGTLSHLGVQGPEHF